MLGGDRRAACRPRVDGLCGNQGSLNGKCRARMHRSCICGKGFHEERKRRPPKRNTTAIGALVLALATVPKLFGRFCLSRGIDARPLAVNATTILVLFIDHTP